MRRLAWGTLPLLAGLLAGGCGGAPPEEGRPVVAVSVLPQAWVVERLAGERVEIEVLIPPGASPHTYEPTVRQMRALSRARLFLAIGHPHFAFERAWLDRIAGSGPALRVVETAAGIDCGEDDPHVWVAPDGLRRISAATAAALEILLPADRDELRASLAALEREIDGVDREVREILAPRAGAEFLVFHPAWGCFARAYGLTQVAIEREGKEPTPADLARVVERARGKGTRVVFVQPQLSRQSAESIAREIGGRVVEADPLARDWPGTLRSFAAALVAEEPPER